MKYRQNNTAHDYLRRIILPVNNSHLYSLNANIGAQCDSFADKSNLNLQSNIQVIIVASSVTDNYSDHEPSGVVRGFDVTTGAIMSI